MKLPWKKAVHEAPSESLGHPSRMRRVRVRISRLFRRTARSSPVPIAFPEVSFSSAAENGSSLRMQADFVRRLRRFLASSDGGKLLFARYVGWRDPPPEVTRVAPGASDVVRRRASFFANRGLKTWKGEPKPAWREWVK